MDSMSQDYYKTRSLIEVTYCAVNVMCEASQGEEAFVNLGSLMPFRFKVFLFAILAAVQTFSPYYDIQCSKVFIGS